MKQVIGNWIKGGLLVIAVPCVFVGAVGVGLAFRLLGVKVSESNESDTVH